MIPIMQQLIPVHQHHSVWFLNHIMGIPIRDLKQATGISTSAWQRLQQGYEPTVRHRPLINQYIVALVAQIDRKQIRHPMLRAYVRSVVSLGTHIANGVLITIPDPIEMMPHADTHYHLRTKGSRIVADAIAAILIRAPNYTLPSSVIFARLPTFKRHTLYRAAASMKLIKASTGFGDRREATWTLPHQREAARATDDLPLFVYKK